MGFWDWWIFQPPPLTHPEDFPGYNPPNVEHLPITTRKGRVVYNRKKHEFNQKDWDRLSGTLFGGNADRYSTVWWENILQRVTLYMIDEILRKLRADMNDYQIAHRIYWLLQDALARFFTKLSPEEQTELEALNGASGGGH